MKIVEHNMSSSRPAKILKGYSGTLYNTDIKEVVKEDGEIKFDMDTIMGCDLLAWKYMVKALAKKYGKDNVRFVFLFDS